MSAMDLLTFIADGERKARLAAATGRSEGYLWQIATGWRGKRPSPELALDIERASRELTDCGLAIELVAKESLRPDLWPPVDASSVSTIARPSEQQGDHVSSALVRDVEVPNGGEAQCGRDVHGVKPASQDARAA